MHVKSVTHKKGGKIFFCVVASFNIKILLVCVREKEKEIELKRNGAKRAQSDTEAEMVAFRVRHQ